MDRKQIYTEISQERERQHGKWGKQVLPYLISPNASLYANAAIQSREECDAAFAKGNVTWQHILNEEIFEFYAVEITITPS